MVRGEEKGKGEHHGCSSYSLGSWAKSNITLVFRAAAAKYTTSIAKEPGVKANNMRREGEGGGGKGKRKEERERGETRRSREELVEKRPGGRRGLEPLQPGPCLLLPSPPSVQLLHCPHYFIHSSFYLSSSSSSSSSLPLCLFASLPLCLFFASLPLLCLFAFPLSLFAFAFPLFFPLTRMLRTKKGKGRTEKKNKGLFFKTKLFCEQGLGWLRLTSLDHVCIRIVF